MGTREVIMDALKRAEQEPQFRFYKYGAESPEQRFARQQEEKSQPDPTFGETVGAAVTADSIVNTGVRETIGRLALETDPEYVPPDPDSSEFAAMTDGVPEQYWSRLANARSARHAQYIKQNIVEELDAMDTLSRAGWGGTSARIATAVLDPPALALALATGGASVIASGGRAARAAKLAATAGAENLAIEASLLGLRETKDENDLYYALVGGVAAGGALGAILPKSARIKLYEAGKRARDGEQLSDKEIIDAIDEQSDLLVDDGGRSVGAQEATRGVDALGEESKDILANAPPKLTGVEAKLRWGWWAQLAKSDSPHARYAADKLLLNAVGSRGVAQKHTAEEFRTMLVDSALGNFERPAYRASQEALRGVPLGKRRAAEDAFYNEVTLRALREQFDDTPAGRAAAGMADAIKTTFDAAKRFGVPGFDTLEYRRGYVPHIPSGSKLDAKLQQFGSDQVERAFAESFAKESGVDLKYARRVVKGYITGVRNRHAGVHSDFYVALADHEMIADLMRKAGVGEDDIADTVKQLKVFGEKDTSKAGKPARAKRRLDFDETYRTKLTDQAGNKVDFSVMDIFETDSRFLTQLYVSTVGGHAAMARAGFKGQKEWDAFITEMQQSGRSGTRVHYETKLLQRARDYILGRPLIDYSSGANAAIFAARDWAFVAQSGAFWAAQGSELATVLTANGLRTVTHGVPGMKGMFTRAADGTLDSAFAREMESLTGIGLNALHDSVLGRFSVGVDEGAVTVADRLQKTYGWRHTLKKAAGYANALTPLTIGMQRSQAAIAAQRVLNELMERGGKGFNEIRLRAMGLPPDMEKKVAAQLKKHVTFDAHDIPRLNAEEWTDLDARDAFALAIQRETNRNVLKPSLGASLPFTKTGEAGKLVTQFQTFALQAHEALLLHGVKHMDAERIATWLFGTGMAAMFYVARTHLESVGKKDRRKFLRERLAADAIAKAAFARAGFSAMIPAMYDTAAHALPGLDPVFSHARTSGLGTSLGSANSYPAGAVAVSAFNLMSSLDDGQFTQSEWRNAQRMLPFARVMGIQQGLEILGSGLPARAVSDD